MNESDHFEHQAPAHSVVGTEINGTIVTKTVIIDGELMHFDMPLGMHSACNKLIAATVGENESVRKESRLQRIGNWWRLHVIPDILEP